MRCSPPLDTLYKIGGSLLDRPDFLAQLDALEPPAASAFLVGGGRTADVVRDWSKRFPLADADAHDLAIAAMDFNARLIERLSPRFRCVASLREVKQTLHERRRPLLLVSALLHEFEGDPLPATWDVTSDSIALWLAAALPANRLVLLKSTPRPAGNWQAAARAGYVDAYFPSLLEQRAMSAPAVDAVMLPASHARP